MTSCPVHPDDGRAASPLSAVLKACLYSRLDTVSAALAFASILAWIPAQLPQLWTNYRRATVQGLSPLFLLAMASGDVANALGCLLGGQAWWQLFLAYYFLSIDLVLFLQVALYRGSGGGRDSEPTTCARPHERGRTLQVSWRSYQSLIGEDTPRHRSVERRRQSAVSMPNSAPGPGFLKAAIVAVSIISAVAQPTGRAYSGPSSDLASSSFRDNLAMTISYFCTLCYFSSRIPQLLHHFRRRSVQGLSPTLFVMTLVGNSTYLASLLLSPEARASPGDVIWTRFTTRDKLVPFSRWTEETSRLWWRETTPFLLGSGGTIIFDLILIAQTICYAKARPVRHLAPVPANYRHDEPDDEYDSQGEQDIFDTDDRPDGRLTSPITRRRYPSHPSNGRSSSTRLRSLSYSTIRTRSPSLDTSS